VTPALLQTLEKALIAASALFPQMLLMVFSTVVELPQMDLIAAGFGCVLQKH